MNQYLKLVHMEVHRFRWVLAALMGITAISQMSALAWTTTSELSQLNARLAGGIISHSNSSPDQLSFEWIMLNSQMWYILPILLCIGVLSFYVSLS